MEGFLNGGSIIWAESKLDPILEVTFFPQASYRTDKPHVHDHVGGGGIAFNAWHSNMLLAFNTNSRSFFRFTSIPDQDGVQVEIPDGVKINSELIQNAATYDNNMPANTRNVPSYCGVWQFIYSPEILEQRWAALEI